MTELRLKIDQIGAWIAKEWCPRFPNEESLTLVSEDYCSSDLVLNEITEFELPQGYHYKKYSPVECDLFPRLHHTDYHGDLTYRTGAVTYTFENDTDTVAVLVISSHIWDEISYEVVVVVNVPTAFQPIWAAFERECNRIHYSRKPEGEVVIIGGHRNYFVPTVEWDDIILPEDLKSDLVTDVSSFFRKGVDVYKRLKLKPFRKLLLAGSPGTGKTMICNALAKWALEQEFLAIYISSADSDGPTFEKIERALHLASNSETSTLILLEEIDAYMQKREEKSLVLNVLDGSETPNNPHGILLVSTTNYPEAIDERVLRRPGRLDRIFMIPEVREKVDATRMLKLYLGEMWRDEHQVVAEEMVGYPGAFIREVAIYALTQVANDDLDTLSLDLLQNSFVRLREQIRERDDFLQIRKNGFLLSTN